MQTANEFDNGVTVTCLDLHYLICYCVTADHRIGSDGHYSVYEKEFLREAGESAEKRATIRQGQQM